MANCNRPEKVRIKSVREDEEATGGCLYEIEPITYEGPWQLEPNMVLEVTGSFEDDDRKDQR